MREMIRKHVKNQRGVTLIELLAVIVILGIIAAVAVPVVVNQISDAGKNTDEASIAIIADAVQRAAIKGDITTPTSETEPVQLSVLVDKGYLKEVPVPKEKGKTNFSATIDSNGKVTVTAN
ncbi:competence type IV pilus major pilin ComGC [Tepidibacillus infernus]|uniref:Prepilin-type N-terminal cleavage/methylation domain-containing protein n=1 Tax=Tepidibacillus decaturensis TaxID=1413211 RepID=A0A135L239_9BACI|nr:MULTISPECIES: prepilin-type N-terminal cleavage/methylation domain-containing protein [Tepidibacillus]KXG43045.1 hypothetical protein U473_02660 [Tepidibacillus decaturensis]GBF10819.1 type II secretion system protein G precursor [Tepidibacillus sp. HK-1]